MNIGDTVIWAIGLVPQRADQRRPGFGDIATVTSIQGEKATVRFERTGLESEEWLTNFWPADSLMGRIAGGLSAMVGANHDNPK